MEVTDRATEQPSELYSRVNATRNKRWQDGKTNYGRSLNRKKDSYQQCVGVYLKI